MTRTEAIRWAAHAHTNLNTFGAVIAVLEGGTLYGNDASYGVTQRIIKICKKEMGKWVSQYDAAVALASKEKL